MDDCALRENRKKQDLSKRHTLFYNASNYESLIKEFKIYTVVLLGTKYVESKTMGSKPYTTYQLRVIHENGTKWITHRRYSEFRSLMEKLKSKYSSNVPHGFPPKKILRNMNPLLIDRRHMALQAWLDKVVSDKILGCSPELKIFLEEHKIEETLREIEFEESIVKLDLEKMGYVYKLRAKQWKKRWIIMRHGILYKYYSHQDKHPFGKLVLLNNSSIDSIDMDATNKQNEKLFCFKLCYKKKDLIFGTTTEQDRTEWITAISGCGQDDDSYSSKLAGTGEQILGTKLEDIDIKDDNGIPLFLSCMMDYVKVKAKGKKDIFSKAPDAILISQIQQGIIDYELIKNPYTVAGLILVFLREMPIPIIPNEYKYCFLSICEIPDELSRENILNSLIDVLPLNHKLLLKKLCEFLIILSDEQDDILEHLCKTFGILIIRISKPEIPSTFTIELTSEREFITKITQDIVNTIKKTIKSNDKSKKPKSMLKQPQSETSVVRTNLKKPLKRQRNSLNFINLDPSLQKTSSVKLHNFDTLQVIGKGTFGKVWKVKKKDTGKIYAMKSMRKDSVVEENLIEHTLVEKEIMKSVGHHPFIINLHYSFQSETDLYFILDYVSGGSLFDALQRSPELKEQDVIFYAAEIILGLECLHSNNIIYRDLKLENILLSKDGHCVLTDFGLSAKLKSDSHTVKSFSGSGLYLAPEILTDSEGKGHGKSVDWWGFGVLLHILLTSAPPFYSENHNELFELIKTQELDLDNDPYLSNNAKSILKSLLERDVSKRLGCGINGCEDVKKHPFFKDIKWKKVLKKKYKPPVIPSYDISNEQQIITPSEPLNPTIAETKKRHDSLFRGFSFVNMDLLIQKPYDSNLPQEENEFFSQISKVLKRK